MKTNIKCYLPDVLIIDKVLPFEQRSGYQISRYNIPEIWQQTEGEDVTVAVLDSGCQLDHPDLSGSLIPGPNIHDRNKNVNDGNGHGCVHPDTIIHTTFCGIERIEDLYNSVHISEKKINNSYIKDISHLNIKTQSLSDSGITSIPTKITHLHKIPIHSQIIELCLEGNITILLTPWHPVPILKKNFSSHKKRADKINIGDRMIFPQGENAGKLTSEYFRAYGKKYTQYVSCGCATEQNYCIEKQTQHLIDEDWAYLIGIIITNGYIDDRIEIYSEIPEIIDKLMSLTQNKGFNPILNKQRNVLINSKDFVELILNLGIQNKRTNDSQELPGFIGKSPHSVICSFIAGLIDGNGRISSKNTKNKITTTSKKFAEQLCALLNSMGISCGIQKYKNLYSCTFLSVPKQIQKYLAHPQKISRALNKPKCSKKSRTVKNIKKYEYDGYFYDFTVESKSHTYVANGHFVSNTHVAGIVTANNNTDGIVGVAPKCKILVIKVLGDDGSGYLENVAMGITYAIEQNVDVISMSLGAREGHPILHEPILKAYKTNIPIICAAGNAGNIGRLAYPAKYPETISIGALNNANLRAEFSQTGPMLDFMAPGVEIYSTYPVNTYRYLSGTSMSTPWAAGVVALMISKHRKLGGKTPVNTVEDIRKHLMKTAIDIREVGKDNETGFGIIDVRAAIKLIKKNKGEIPMPTPFEGLSEKFNAWISAYNAQVEAKTQLTTSVEDLQNQIAELTEKLTSEKKQLENTTAALVTYEEKANQINKLISDTN